MNTQNLLSFFKKSINILGLICTTLALIFASAFYSLPAVANQQVVNQPILIAYAQDIVSTAVEAGEFNTLAAALKAADLVEVLQYGGPFTVFAPTDEAFAALPPGLVEYLLQPENKDKLIDILTYHVVPGEVTSGDLESGYVKTVEGDDIYVQVSYRGVKVDDANVIIPDVLATNGVIHVIDSVILP
ncbi:MULTISPECIES: fasciclin domain-containing protein [Okeania]|uniref:Fasciclin domain-containing protein n=1 Tax=Okeania hirsuta TaxID=1458930 RepID=A0A3N6NYS4_9CYAN|nr:MULTISPECIES: fasciclin domain-containing protein [Okeania]NET12169.1 fasciclin domain-containing protein [Okeania sp. SIO1H6]NES76819.1 fasciclin domain-containing protein [Okeania sp. SIO1H4]NET20447.1 fasciclin domain-containing protein [Okeania sp. SIO1H5]NET77140.1 fasciclin domain-containing protein [Okeania sp. SIO1F9]NET94598.1 fasciclin domain-containing protein [Okeania sp. SIO1H2]